MRVRMEGLSKLSQYNGQLGTIEREVEGGRLRVVLDQDGKVLSLKRESCRDPTGARGKCSIKPHG